MKPRLGVVQWLFLYNLALREDVTLIFPPHVFPWQLLWENVVFGAEQTSVVHDMQTKKKIFFSDKKALVNFSLSMNDQAFSYDWIFLNEQISPQFSTGILLCVECLPSQPWENQQRGSVTLEWPQGALLLKCRSSTPKESCWSPSRSLWVCSIQGGNVWRIRDCTHSLENVCCIYLPSDKYSSKSKTTWLFTEFKDSFLALELYKWLC